MPRSSAIRSTSSMTSIAGCRARATEHASAIRCMALPVSCEDRGADQAAGQVPDGVRLADARRPVQQQAALEVLAGGEQPAPCGGRPRRPAAAPRRGSRAAGSAGRRSSWDGGGTAAASGRARTPPSRTRAPGRGRRCAPGQSRPDLRGRSGRGRRVGAHDLDRHRVLPDLRRGPAHQHSACARPPRSPGRRRSAWQGRTSPSGPAREVDAGRVARAQTERLLGRPARGEQVAEAEHHVLEAGDTDEFPACGPGRPARRPVPACTLTWS